MEIYLCLHGFRFMIYLVYVWDNDRGTRRPRRFRFTDNKFRGHYTTPINYDSLIVRCVALPRPVIRENECV